MQEQSQNKSCYKLRGRGQRSVRHPLKRWEESMRPLAGHLAQYLTGGGGEEEILKKLLRQKLLIF